MSIIKIRRMLYSLIVKLFALFAVLLCVVPVFMLVLLGINGSWEGLMPAWLDTMLLTLLAGSLSALAGLTWALFITEGLPIRFHDSMRKIVDVCAGLAPVVMGVLILLWMDEKLGVWRLLCALTMTTAPLATRHMLCALKEVQEPQRAAARALGASPVRIVLDVVLPAARRAMAAALLFAMARVCGQSSVILLLAGSRMLYLPQWVFHGGAQAFPAVLLLSITTVLLFAAGSVLNRTRR